MAAIQTTDNQALKAVLGAFGTFAALATAVYVFGGVVLLLRLESQGLRGEVVVASLPRGFLISVGLAVLFQFLFYLLILLGAFGQQAVDETKMGDNNRLLPRAIRLAIVGGAAAVLAVPLTRWIGFADVPWWWTLVLAYGLYVAVMAFWVAGQGELKSDELKLRWGGPLAIIGVACLVIGLVAIFEFHRPLELLAVFLGAVLTAVCLWFLLRRLVDRPDETEVDPPLPGRGARVAKQAALMTVVAFFIFVPWRVALEASSIKGLNVLVCTSNPTQYFNGLFIGENANSVFVGETDGAAPRIAELPRDQVTRIFLGTGAAAQKTCPTPTPTGGKATAG